MPQVRIELDDELYGILKQYAEEEIREASGQATWLVRQALKERAKMTAALRALEGHGAGPVPAALASSHPPLLPSEEEAQIFGPHP